MCMPALREEPATKRAPPRAMLYRMRESASGLLPRRTCIMIECASLRAACRLESHFPIRPEEWQIRLSPLTRTPNTDTCRRGGGGGQNRPTNVIETLYFYYSFQEDSVLS